VTGDTPSAVPPIDVFKALGDPIRWSMIAQMAWVDELACITLEDTLPVSKPTISYHAKILNHAGLISVRKEGRNHFYSLRRDVLHQVLDCLWELAPTPRPVVGKEKGYVSTGRRQRRNDAASRPVPARQQHRRDAADSGEEAVLLTW
jgi:DNA-binding transcriptional ArsR family regulator